MKNLNDPTDQFIAGVTETAPLSTTTSFNKPGLPSMAWGQKLTLDEEAMERLYPDLCDND